LLSALSVIAKNPARIRDLFLVSEYNAYGIYGMTFFVSVTHTHTQQKLQQATRGAIRGE